MVKQISTFLLLSALCCAGELNAADRYTMIGAVVEGRSVEVALASSATLVVSVEVEQEVVTVGDYARYAQKYLGVRAPLQSKQESRIVSASVAQAPENYYVASDEMLIQSEMREVASYSDPLPIDVNSADRLSLEDSAEEAAEAIFTIRRLRRDIISGELGEGFYGGGLAASLDRLAEEERQYLELFMGRTTTSRSKHTFYVALDGATERYIVGRFSAVDGIVSAADLTAEPILLQLAPMKSEQLPTLFVDEKSTPVKIRIPERVKCELYCSSRLLGGVTLPLYEFGYDYIHPISSK